LPQETKRVPGGRWFDDCLSAKHLERALRYHECFMRRNTRSLALGLLLFALPASAGIWDLCLGIYQGVMGPAAPPPPPPAPPPAAEPGAKPPVPVAVRFRNSPPREDPAYPGTYLHTAAEVTRAEGSGFEEGSVSGMLDRHPRFLALLGIRRTAAGAIEYPEPAGINARIRALRARADPLAPVMELWLDRSPEGASQLTIVRGLAEGRVPVSETGRADDGQSLHHHDLWVHGLGYLLIPPRVVDIAKARAAFMLAVHDHPDLQANPKIRSRVLYSIQSESQRMDEWSSKVVEALVRRPGGDRDRLSWALSTLGMGNADLRRDLEMLVDSGEVSRREARAIRELLATPPVEGLGRRSNDIAAAMLRSLFSVIAR